MFATDHIALKNKNDVNGANGLKFESKKPCKV
jgi:hypothetical protein